MNISLSDSRSCGNEKGFSSNPLEKHRKSYIMITFRTLISFNAENVKRNVKIFFKIFY